MGAGVFHGRVRDGIGCVIAAMATGPPSRMRNLLPVFLTCCPRGASALLWWVGGVAGRGLVLRAVPLGRLAWGREPWGCGGMGWEFYRAIRTV